MNLQNAKEIGRKARAYEHCAKLLKQIDKHGSATMKLNCTGVEFLVQKDDGIYLRLKTVFASLAEELNLIAPHGRAATPRVTPVGAASDDEIKREKMRQYSKAYYEAHRKDVLARQKKYRDAKKSKKTLDTPNSL